MQVLNSSLGHLCIQFLVILILSHVHSYFILHMLFSLDSCYLVSLKFIKHRVKPVDTFELFSLVKDF